MIGARHLERKQNFEDFIKKTKTLHQGMAICIFFLHPLLNCLAIVNEFLADT